MQNVHSGPDGDPWAKNSSEDGIPYYVRLVLDTFRANASNEFSSVIFLFISSQWWRSRHVLGPPHVGQNLVHAGRLQPNRIRCLPGCNKAENHPEETELWALSTSLIFCLSFGDSLICCFARGFVNRVPCSEYPSTPCTQAGWGWYSDNDWESFCGDLRHLRLHCLDRSAEQRVFIRLVCWSHVESLHQHFWQVSWRSNDYAFSELFKGGTSFSSVILCLVLRFLRCSWIVVSPFWPVCDRIFVLENDVDKSEFCPFKRFCVSCAKIVHRESWDVRAAIASWRVFTSSLKTHLPIYWKVYLLCWMFLVPYF